MKPALESARRVVVKLGTGVLTSGDGAMDARRVSAICEGLERLRARGIQVIVVSSGAIGLGMGRLGFKRRPSDLASLQACAAVGQSILINTWQAGFDPAGATVAQILLTREDLRGRQRHNAVSRTVERLLARKAVPVVNENDTVSAAEIKFGDNDTLSALVASLAKADHLFILSTIPGLIDLEGSGEVIPCVETITPEIEAMAQGTRSATAIGGMVSKISAAKIALRAGCGVVIGSGRDETWFDRLLAGESAGTYFPPSPDPVKARRRWIAIQDRTPGRITVDEGAAEAILRGGKSLLAKGVAGVDGTFDNDDVIAIADPSGRVIARGIPSVGSADAERMRGLDSRDIKERLPHRRDSVVVHRDNLVLLD